MKRTCVAGLIVCLLLGAGRVWADGDEASSRRGKGTDADRHKGGTSSQVHGPRRGRRARSPYEGIIHELFRNPAVAADAGVTEEQLSQLRAHFSGVKKRQKSLTEELKAAAMLQAKLITDSTVDEEALLRAVEETGRIRTDLAKLRVMGLLAVKRILRPEQLETIRGNVKKWMKKHRENHQGMRRGEDTKKNP